MYQRRFQNSRPIRLINIRGLLTLTYVGNGTFYYTIIRNHYPKVGKIELGYRKNHRHFFSLLAGSVIIFAVFLMLSGDTKAVPITSENDLKLLEETGRFEELEKRSEEMKSQLYNLANPISSLKDTVKIKKYRVKAGDTLSEIAQRHNVPATIIAATSKIKFHSTLRQNQELSIPERPGLVYKVKKGDTLAAVLSKYSVKVNEVYSQNPHLTNLDMIEPGVDIFLPNAKIPPPPRPWLRPMAGRFSSRFGWRRHPILRRRHFHTGVDIGARYRPVRAARRGRVVYAGYLGAYGKVVVIRHDRKFKTLYAHLSRIRVRTGSYVKQGQVVAISGSSGRSTGPHLHFEIVRNGRPVNPRRYIRF